MQIQNGDWWPSGFFLKWELSTSVAGSRLLLLHLLSLVCAAGEGGEPTRGKWEQVDDVNNIFEKSTEATLTHMSDFLHRLRRIKLASAIMNFLFAISSLIVLTLNICY